MARELHRLSARKVEALRNPGRHADGGGLYLSISEPGGRRWVFLYRWRGKATEMGLGSARDVSLARARTLGRRRRSETRRGAGARRSGPKGQARRPAPPA
jgi:hypothetical protein